MPDLPVYKITQDDLSPLTAGGPVFVTLGEVMVRDTPADEERPEQTRLVRLSMAGSEYSVAIGLARLGIPSAFVTRVPDNPYGHAVQNIARAHGVHTDHFVWAPRTEPIGRYIYETGVTPRNSVGIYQRMYSAASRLGAGDVDWKSALKDAQLLHVTGITLGLAVHSGYARNHNYEALQEALANKPRDCRVGLEFNYRSTLWSIDQARALLTPVLNQGVDILITALPDMAQFYSIGCGRYSPAQVLAGEARDPDDDDLRSFAEQVCRQFPVHVVAITLRHADSVEQNRWESAAVDAAGYLVRSPAVRSIMLRDRLGGGDAWTAGFYYGLLTERFGREGLAKGVVVGDACTGLKQTLMFDLPIVDRAEVEQLLEADAAGTPWRTRR